MKNVDSSSNSATPSIPVGLPTFSTVGASQRQGESPQRTKNLVGSSDSFHPSASQNSTSGRFLGSFPGPYHSSVLPHSSKGTQSVRGGSRTPSSRDSRVPHPTVPTGMHSMSIGSLVGTSTSTATSALPTPVLVNFLMASPPSARESNRRSERARGETRSSICMPVAEGGKGMCRAMSSSLTWPSRPRSQSIATRESSHHSCEILGFHGMLQRSPSLRTHRGPISPLLNEADGSSKNFCTVSPSHRSSLLSHLGKVDRNGSGSVAGPGDIFTPATSEEETAAIAEFEVEAHKIPESELRSSVSTLLQKVRIIQIELTQERETVHNLYDGVSRTFSETEKRQENTTNRMMRRLQNLREKRHFQEKHLHDVRENKLEQERNLAKVKKNIEKLTEHLKSEEDVISRRIRRSIDALKKKRLALEEALRKESYSVHQLEQLVNEFQLLDSFSATGGGGTIDRSTGSDVPGLATGQVDKMVNSSTSTLWRGEESSRSFSRKSSSSIPPQPQYRGPARLLEGKEDSGSAHRSGEILFPVAEKAIHLPSTSTLHGEGKMRAPKGMLTSPAKSGQAECTPLPLFTSVSTISCGGVPMDRATRTPPRPTTVRQNSTSKCAVQIPSRSRSLGSESGSATFVAPPPPPLNGTETSPTASDTESNSQILVSLQDSSVPNTPKVDHTFTDASGTTKNVSQVASIRFLEKAISISSHFWADAIRQQENCRSQIQALQMRVDEELQIKQGEVDALQHMKREFTESFGAQSEKSFSTGGDAYCRSPRHSSWPMPLPLPAQHSVAKTPVHHSIEKEGNRDGGSDRSGHGRKTMGRSVERGRARRCPGVDARMPTSPYFSEPEVQGTSYVAPPPPISLNQVVVLSDMERARQGGAGVPVCKPKGVGGAKGTVAFHGGAFHVITTASLSDREVVGDGAENSSPPIGLNPSASAGGTSGHAPSEAVDRTLLFQDAKANTPPPRSDVE